MKKQITFLIVLLLTACSQAPGRPPNAEEQLATIAVKTNTAGQLGTIVAGTLTAQPPTFTPIPAATATEVVGAAVIPTGDAPIVSGLLGCSRPRGLVLFRIDANTTYRNWEGMAISINETRVICSEPPGDSTTLTCELASDVAFPATVTFGMGDGIVGTFTFSKEQCDAAELSPALAVVFTTTTAENVNLRTKPGLLFPVSRVMAQGTRLQLRGMSPGGDWAFVQNNEGVEGWVGMDFVKPFPKAQLPVMKPQGVQEISGSVLDADGVPIQRINFAITQGEKRTDAKTNALGEFHAYLPTSASGIWTVGFISFDAESNALTVECLADTNACGRTNPLSVEVTLPTTGPIIFGWR